MAKGNGGTRTSISGRINGSGIFTQDDLSNFFTSVDKVFLKKYNKEDDDTARALGGDRLGTVFAPKGDVENVSVSSIHPCQPGINAKQVVSLAQDIKENGMNEIPSAIKVGRDVYLLDGHHRVAAEIINSVRTVKIRLVEVSREEWKQQKKQIITHGK